MKGKMILGATLLLLALALPAIGAAEAAAAAATPANAVDSLSLLESEADSTLVEAGGIDWGFREKLRQRVRVMRILVNVVFSLVEGRIGGSEQAGWGG